MRFDPSPSSNKQNSTAVTVGAMLLAALPISSLNTQRDTSPPKDPTPSIGALDLSAASMPQFRRHIHAETVIPEGVERIQLSTRGQQWLDYELAIARNSLSRQGMPRLVDGTTFLTPGAAAALASYDGLISADGKLKFSAVSEQGYKFAFIRATETGKETWYLSESPHYRDQFPSGIPFAETSFELWKAGSDKLTQKEFASDSVFKQGRIDFSKVVQIISAAETARDGEIRDLAGIRRYELTSAACGYIGLVDGNQDDPIVAGGAEDVKFLAQVLNALRDSNGNLRYNLVSANGSDCVIVDRSPINLLNEQVKALHEKGIRNFYLNLSGHGNEYGVYFSANGRSFRLSPQELHSVFDRYRDSSFVVDTLACYGGGIAEAIKNYRDSSGRADRILIKLQAKPFSYNQEGRVEGERGLNGAPKVHSSYYAIFNVYFLQKGLGFGEAHYQADLAAKRLIPCDAEAWFSGRDGGRQTPIKE